MRRAVLVNLSILLASAPLLALATNAAETAACSGEACAAINLSDDGCAWTNAGDRAVRFSLLAGKDALILTVMAPGDTYKQFDRAHCVTESNENMNYHASFAVLRAMPEEVPVIGQGATPRAKPGDTVITAAKVPAPRAKPAAAAAPVLALSAPAATRPAPRAKPVDGRAPELAAAQVPSIDPVVFEGTGCGDACGEILFKLVEDCLWVQNQNPRAIRFIADIEGRLQALTLEGASGAKADATPGAVAALSYHTRQRDPFQSSSAGIAVFRAKINQSGTCIKDRKTISRFHAEFVR